MDALEIFRRQYLSLYPPHLLTLPPRGLLSSEQGQRFLLERVLSVSRGPEDGYRRRIWRRVVQAMEDGIKECDDDDAEVDERFYQVLSELMMVPDAGPSTAPPTSYRTFIYDLPRDHPLVVPAGTGSLRHQRTDTTERSICLLEEQIAIQGGTTGLRTWTAALHLGHHILHHSAALFPSSLPRGVVELGAGTGFLSVLMAQLGVDVVATDLGIETEQGSAEKPDAAPGFGTDGDGETRTPLGRLLLNVGLNHCPAPLAVRALDWTDASLPTCDRPAIWQKLERERRIILAADVIYDPDLVPPLVDAISTLLGKVTDGAEAIISATVRNLDTFSLFLNTCRSQGIHAEHIEVPPMNSQDPSFWDSALDAGTEVKIMRLTRAE
ncbi:hypothetical protein IAU60_004041 [Kwoniella sp. DSM 27419]